MATNLFINPLNSAQQQAETSQRARLYPLDGNAYTEKTEDQGKGYLYVLFVALVHLSLLYFYQHSNHSSMSTIAKPIQITLLKPEPEQKIIPPPPPKPLPRKSNPVKAPSVKQDELKTDKADSEPQPKTISIQENPQSHSSPLAAVATETSPAPVTSSPSNEAITDAIGYAGYMQNPAPEYPASALRMGREGRVLLRVHVLSNGHADVIEIKESSGYKQLDEAAQKTVSNWLFTPAKKGKIPMDSWVSVPIEFKLSK